MIEEVKNGNKAAFDALFSVVYDELYRRAKQQRGRWDGDHTLNTTALMHEAYLKLVAHKEKNWTNRVHFMNVAAQAMRHILLNYAEKKKAIKRGGDLSRGSLSDADLILGAAWRPTEWDRLLTLEAALQRLEQIHPRLSRIVACRFYGGLTFEETATALNLSTATVKRSWVTAKAWLYRELDVSSA